jgi:hypothetical protein
MSDRQHFPADHRLYRAALTLAWDARPEIAASVTDYRDDTHHSLRPYLSADRQSGFMIAGDEIVGVFSAVRGRGDALVRDAIAAGGRRLDCFDGYLTRLYYRHGFVVTRRESNWSPGGPDVVWMTYRPVDTDPLP